MGQVNDIRANMLKIEKSIFTKLIFYFDRKLEDVSVIKKTVEREREREREREETIKSLFFALQDVVLFRAFTLYNNNNKSKELVTRYHVENHTKLIFYYL